MKRSAEGVWISSAGGEPVPPDVRPAIGKVAQAEFYYDQTHAAADEDRCWNVQGANVRVSPGQCGLTWDRYKDVALWNLRWRARLRRFSHTDTPYLPPLVIKWLDVTKGAPTGGTKNFESLLLE